MIEDIKSFLSEPKHFAERLLSDPNFKITKGHLAFILVMNLYYCFLPSVIIAIHILIPVVLLLQAASAYYFGQEALAVYREKTLEGSDDNKYFYRIAYLFALGNVPIAAYLVVVNLLALIFAKPIFLAAFIAFALMMIGMLFAPVYPMKIMRYLAQNPEKPATTSEYFGILTKTFIDSWVCAVKSAFGISAIRSLVEDLGEVD